MKQIKKTIVMLLTVAMVVGAFAGMAFAADNEGDYRIVPTNEPFVVSVKKVSPYIGWQKEGGNWYYYKKDKRKLSPGEDGKLYGWLKEGDKYYFLDRETGAMVNGEAEAIDGTIYFFKSNGVCDMTDGWKTIKRYVNAAGDVYNAKYYVKNGVAVTGWNKIDGKWYFFATASDEAGDGSIYSLFQRDIAQMLDNTWYFGDNAIYRLGKGGAMVTGLAKVDGNTYFFKKNGAMGKGWYKINGKTYYFRSTIDPTTVGGFWSLKAERRYINGEVTKFSLAPAVRGFQTIKGKLYYFHKNNQMATGWTKVRTAKLNDSKTTIWRLKKFTKNGALMYDTGVPAYSRYSTAWIYATGSGSVMHAKTANGLKAHYVGNTLRYFDNNGFLMIPDSTTGEIVVANEL